MRRWWLGLVVVGAVGCGSTPEASPWDGRAQVLPCGLEPVQCLTGPANAPLADELTSDSPAVGHYLAANEYAGASAAGCDLAYVYELPPDKLSGRYLQIVGGWNEAELAPRGLERCADYDATLHVYTPDADDAEGFRLVDHRIFEGEANESSGLCDARIRSAGPGEPAMPRNEPIWLTADSYSAGLRIVVSALDACEPLPLSFRVAEEFPSAGVSQPDLGAQGTRPRVP
jgi:hypothetical protein